MARYSRGRFEPQIVGGLCDRLDTPTRTVVVTLCRLSDPGGIVREGFDALGERYLGWQLEAEEDPRRPYLERFMKELPGGARVLDLGCGPGIPATRLLVERFDLTGVDFSAAQVELARSRVPEARFIEADLCEVDFPRESFDGVTSLFAVSHTPRAGHEGLFRRIAGWLRAGGLFLANFRARERNNLVYEWAVSRGTRRTTTPRRPGVCCVRRASS